MKAHRTVLLLAALGIVDPAAAADLAKVDRTIQKEPAYRSKSPRYALLVFGPEAKERVWLVHDGDALYADRNGNGDLTEPGEKVSAKKRTYLLRDQIQYDFHADDLSIGGRLHKNLTITGFQIAGLVGAVADKPHVKAALAADSKALVYSIVLDLEKPGFQGKGSGGRVIQIAAHVIFAPTPSEAPIIHFDGPLQISCDDKKPTLFRGHDNDLAFIVGTPGFGPSTFAMLAYEDTIPAQAVVKVECAFPAQQSGGAPVREPFELQHRC
jgi:hypothetical protein